MSTSPITIRMVGRGWERGMGERDGRGWEGMGGEIKTI